MSSEPQKANNPSPQKNTKRLLIGAVIFIGLYTVSLFVPFVSPYTQYPLHVIRCGKLPVAASTFAAGFTYTPPGNNPYRVDFFTDRYFCTEEEAKEAGFHKYEYGPNANP